MRDEAIAAVLDQWPVGVIVARADGEVVYRNPEVARIFWGRDSPMPAPAIDDYARYRGLAPDGTPLAVSEWPLSRSLRTGAVVRAEEIHFERDDGSRGVTEVSSAPLHVGDEIVGGVVLFVDVTERHANEARAALLRRWTADLPSADPADVLTTLARQLVPVLQGRVWAYAVGPRDAPVALDGAPGAGEVVDAAARAGRVQEGADGHDVLRAVPLVVRGRVRGVVEHRGRRRQLEPPAGELLEAVVRQGAHALERAIVAAEERAALAAEERARRRADATAALVTSLEGVRGLAARARALAEALAGYADWCLVEVPDGGTTVRVASTGAVGRDADAEIVAAYPSRARDPSTSAAEGAAAVHLQTVAPAVIDDIAHDQRHRDALERLGLGSIVVVPLALASEGVVGSVMLVARAPGALGADMVELLESVTSAVGPVLARERARDRERWIAATFQERLLPKVLAGGEGVLVAHRYRAGVDELLVGGDWIDTLALPGGRLGLVVGDVVGRGVDAAATMGQLRAALVALAMDGDPPAAVLSALDRYVALNPAGRSTTLVYAIADPAARELRYSCAGHLPPLLVGAAGACFAAGGQGGPLGVWRAARDDVSVVLDDVTTVLLCTDGLVERRGESLDEGLLRVEAAAAALGAAAPDELCAGLLDAVVASGIPPSDDVALLAMRFCHPDTTFLRSVVAYPTALRGLRHDLRSWLVALDVAPRTVDDLVVACGEACANAVEHAYREVPTGELAIEGYATDDMVVCTVKDFGRWRAAGAVRPGGRGFGLMGELVDELDVERSAGGTSVRLRVRRRT